MHIFAEDELEIIQAHPIHHDLSTVRDFFDAKRDRSTSKGEARSIHSLFVNEPNTELKNTVLDLLLVFQGQHAARGLPFHPSNCHLSTEIAILYAHLSSNTTKFLETVPLLEAIVRKAGDTEIWGILYTIIAQSQSTSHRTPLQSQTFSCFGTPITQFSASQWGSEQQRKEVDARVFEEISSCTYRDVDGFFSKYFEATEWSAQADKIISAAMSRHVHGRWLRFPAIPRQDQVFDWFFDLQQEFFTKQRGIYYTTHNKSLSGSEARRKLDLFVQKNNGEQFSDLVHHWEHVCVVGELKEEDENDEAVAVQLAGYAREVFASQPPRHFVHGFTLQGSHMRLWVFDRSGPFSSHKFDIHELPEQFLRVVVGYLMMSDTELGFNTFIERQADQHFITVKETRTGKKRKIELETKPIAVQRGIVCPGTSCFRAKGIKSTTWQFVVKFSWRSDKRKPEGDLLKLAQKRRVQGVAELYSHQNLTSISEMRDGLRFGRPHHYHMSRAALSSLLSHSRSVTLLQRSMEHRHGLGVTHSSASSLKRKADINGDNMPKRSRLSDQLSEELINKQDTLPQTMPKCKTGLAESYHCTYDNRIFCCLTISPPGRAIHDFRSIKELLEAFRDAIRGHQSLYVVGKILHRDISEKNLIINDSRLRKKFKGMLIDLDLAEEVTGGPSGVCHRTGTLEFMAIEVLQGVSHTYRHDLESFFYVLIWICTRGGRPPLDKSNLLKGWHSGQYMEIANVKRGHMDKQGFENIVRLFTAEFDCVRPLARNIRNTLFPYVDGLFTGTPRDPEILYQPIIRMFDEAAQCVDV